jgi:cyclophilin family peptidyl-prolyl cis-trans isomerase
MTARTTARTTGGGGGFVIDTELGAIALAFEAAAAPVTAAHFKTLVGDGLYDGCCFYRSDFVIQMGNTDHATGGVNPNPRADLPVNETKLSNLRGTMSVAHWDVPDNGNCQVFINLQDNAHLDEAYGGYAVFARVAPDDADSFATVGEIARVIAEKEGHRVLIRTVRLVE